jgi:hypothetical protein
MYFVSEKLEIAPYEEVNKKGQRDTIHLVIAFLDCRIPNFGFFGLFLKQKGLFLDIIG